MERAELMALARATGVAQEHGGYVFLCDPHWSAAQREAFAVVSQSETQSSQSEIRTGWLCIPTGGSSGGLKFARHDETTLTAAVRGFCAHFDLVQVNAVDVLPPWHVSGFMSRVRCAETGGAHVAWDWKRLERGEYPDLDAGKKWNISLVPTQLQRLLQQPTGCDWLRRLHLIFIGGGPIWAELGEAAQAAALPIILSYGMTETAAMIAAQRPGDFARGDRSSGHVMPHAGVTIDEHGVVRVAGGSLMRGYWGEQSVGENFATADVGFFDDGRALYIAGRRDDVVITGGEKVNLREVEAELRSLGCFTDVAVIAVPDAEWGMSIVACFTTVAETPPETVIDRQLTRHRRPKRWLRFSEKDWPRNAQGKLNRAALREAVSALIDPSR